MKIKTARLLESAAKASQFPKTSLPEVAFSGRSNVGKSSLINSLLMRKKLVKTSSIPGKTQLINFFLINEDFCFVDFPGYGFAKVPEKVRFKWRSLIESYLSQRKNLKGVVLIVDIRQGPTDRDRQLLEWLELHSRPVLLVAGKADKLGRGLRQQRIKTIREELRIDNMPLAHASSNREGRQEIWKVLGPWLFYRRNSTGS